MANERSDEETKHQATCLPPFLTTTEFSRLTNLSTATIRRRCQAGEVASIVVSTRGDRRIPASEVDRLHSEAAASRAQP
jgi:excisionase family DNA binding protein